jgi:hypothetical protein
VSRYRIYTRLVRNVWRSIIRFQVLSWTFADGLFGHAVKLVAGEFVGSGGRVAACKAIIEERFPRAFRSPG